MTVPSNLYQKASLKGDREDLLDKIFNTDPTETPVMSGSGRQTATNTLHEWQRDTTGTGNKFTCKATQSAPADSRPETLNPNATGTPFRAARASGYFLFGSRYKTCICTLV